MKFFLILLIGLLMLIYACNKEDTIKDYREAVTGTYSGIRVTTYWIDTVVGFGHDSSNITLTLTKSDLDSILDMSFNPNYSKEKFSFRLKNSLFISTTYYHPPILKLAKDSLYFRHQAGLGPRWTECFAKKND